MKMDIPALQAALMKLDASNDNHWTADGQPRLDTVKMLAGNPAITRDQVEAAAPGYLRANAGSYTMQPPGVGAGAPAAEIATPVAPAAPVAPIETVEHAQGDNDAPSFSNEQAEQPEMAGGLGDESDEVPSLEAQLAKAVARTKEVREALEYVNKELAKAIKAEDALRDQMVLSPKASNTLAIKGYLDMQKQVLEERRMRQQVLRSSGVDLKELTRNLKSPIDAAMARKTGRGGQRPNLNGQK
jgi:hypothetical protein